MFNFSASGKNSERRWRGSPLRARAALYRRAAVLFVAQDGGEESRLGARAAVYRRAAVLFRAAEAAEESG